MLLFSRSSKANLVIPATLILATVLYLLTVGDVSHRPDWQFVPGGKPFVVQAGGEASLKIARTEQAVGSARIRIRCGVEGGCQDLRIKMGAGQMLGPDEAGQRGADFLVQVPKGESPLLLVNAGPRLVTIQEYQRADTLANNSGFPRFTVFVGQVPTGELVDVVQWLVILAGMALLTSAVVVSCKKHSGRYLNRWAVGILALPLLTVLGALALRAAGHTLVLGWDAFLLLCGLGLVLQAGSVLARQITGGPGAIAGSLPALVLFFFLPSTIYIHNQGDLDYNLAQLLPFAAALAVCLLAVMLLMLLKSRREAIFKVLFFIGIFVLVRDMAAPLDVGELAGGLAVLDIQEPWLYVVLEVVLLAGALAAAIKFPWGQVRHFATLLVMILTLFYAGSLVFSLERRTHFTLGETPAEHPSPPPAKAASQGNVYHLVVDGFSSQVLPSVLADPELATYFEGFTFFSRARSNYLYTELSIPSFMTGSFAPYMRPGESKEDWLKRVARWKRTATTGGILAAAYNNGYTVTQYMNTRLFYPHKKASSIYFGAQLFGEVAVQSAMIRFADLWLLRAVPTILKQEVWSEENRGIFAGLVTTPGQHAWAYWAVRQMDKMTEAEASRPPKGQYVYGHFLMPHRPLVMDANCGYRPAGKTSEAYHDQAVCAIRKVAAFLAELKRLGRYDNSLIVVQSDHASRLAPMINERDCFPAWLIDKLNKIRPGNRAGNNNQNLNLPLVMVKPPGNRGPLVVSNKLSQLVDLANTIYRVKGWKDKSLQGRDLFAPGDDLQVNLFIHLPLKRIYKTKREYWHLIYDGRNWRISDKYPQPPDK